MATGARPEQEALRERFPVPLLPLGDRPFLQHVVERLVSLEIIDIHVVVSHRPEMVERLLEDGSRWGCRFSFHLARDAHHPYGRLRRIPGEDEERLLLGHADRLPAMAPEEVLGDRPLVLRDGDAWTGWAVVPSAVLQGLDDETEEKDVERIVESLGLAAAEAAPVLSVCSPTALLVSQRLAFDGHVPGLIFGARQAEPGVWISRNVMMHPSVRVRPPVFIGENSRLNRGVRIGPNVLVSADCIVDEGTSLEDAAVFPDSFVGEHLELNGVLVDRNRLVNIRHGAVVDIKDDFILGNMGHGYLGSLVGRLWSRAAAMGLLVFFAPLMLLLAGALSMFRRGPVLHRRQVVRLPAPPERSGWRLFELFSFLPHGAVGKANDGLGPFCLRFLPALLNIARGDMRFVGLPPRTPDEIALLPPDWKELYLGSVAGAVTEAFVHYGAEADEDEQFAAEALYASRPNLRHDLGLLGGYLWRVIAVR